MTTLWRELYDDARARLGSVADARRIVERAAGFDGAAFHAGLSEPVPARARPFFEEMVCRRAAGEPLQYVLGRWAFRTLDLYVDSRVLIPRPETEGLVDVAMIELGKLAVPAPVVVDLGTGSGAIALSFAKEVPGAEVYATDRSAGALAVARANLAGLGTAATRVRLLEGSWYRALPPLLRGRVHLVASNPPYVADDEELDPEVAEWEPVAALRAGPTGLEQVQVVVGEAPAWLARPGALVVEIAPNHADAASALAHGAGFVEVEVRPDLAGRDRVLVARM